DAARAIALVGHLVISGAVLAAGPALDRPLHGVAGHIGVPGSGHRGAKARIGVGIGLAGFGGDRQLADDLGENLGALRVLRALPVHDVFELGMASHGAAFNSIA